MNSFCVKDGLEILTLIKGIQIVNSKAGLKLLHWFDTKIVAIPELNVTQNLSLKVSIENFS